MGHPQPRRLTINVFRDGVGYLFGGVESGQHGRFQRIHKPLVLCFVLAVLTDKPDGCPKKISIPDLFSCLNAKRLYKDWNADCYYNDAYTKFNGKASDCIGCGKCEKSCPQHLEIRKLLKAVAEEFEKND